MNENNEKVLQRIPNIVIISCITICLGVIIFLEKSKTTNSVEEVVCREDVIAKNDIIVVYESNDLPPLVVNEIDWNELIEKEDRGSLDDAILVVSDSNADDGYFKGAIQYIETMGDEEDASALEKTHSTIEDEERRNIVVEAAEKILIRTTSQNKKLLF